LQYRLSQKADADLARLYDWGIDNLGLNQADHYFDRLLTRFEEISQTPLLWQAVEHIRAGYRRSVCGAHSIYYRVEDNGILIVRILRSEDAETSLPKQ